MAEQQYDVGAVPKGIDRQKFIDDWVRSSEELIAECPTKYEHPTSYKIAKDLAVSIRQTGGRILRSAPEWPTIATLPTGRVNAMTVRVPGSAAKAILFESSFFTFANLLSKAVAAAMPYADRGDGDYLSFSSDPENIKRRISSEPGVAERFFQAVAAYARFGDPSRAPQYALGWPHSHLAPVFRESMELFVLGHEYGHVIAGHLDPQSTPDIPAEGDFAADELEYSWRQEIVADHFGSVLSVAAMSSDGYDAALSASGGDLFFSAMDVMDRAVSLLRYGDESAQKLGSHPPATMRREMLRRGWSEYMDEAQAQSAVALADSVQVATGLLWERARKRLVDQYGPGSGVDTSWR
ncbi:hypothetical protein GCU56_18815 [Geodermatophilus sabuli]|uniref:IrrE N-terminal-like domain-containing protein n=1 Tax=Geodermatophilus sabuli TaxID=1564158 RepID=A0A7K3W578_9ACTN|nr:hypothetical protein [Geodermatophilus sabuli]NEK59911.1 hypothetical protein [Geodermatophilus sabuli]